MSQRPPNNDPFVPPPPPTPGNSMYSRHVLAAKAASAAADANQALILSMVGLVCLGFVLGVLAFRKADEALETIAIYDVAQDKKSLAMMAKVLSVIDIVGWIVFLIASFVLA